MLLSSTTARADEPPAPGRLGLSLGAALARTSRQLHTLEHKVAPALRDRIAAIGRALDEREREEHTRLRQLRRRRA